MAAPPRPSLAEFVARIASLDGHLLVTDASGAIPDFDALSRRIAAVAGVRAVVPIVEGIAVASGPKGEEGIRVIGVRPDDLPKIPYVGAVAEPERLRTFAEAPGAAIGSGLARQLAVKVGDKFNLLVVDRSRHTVFGDRVRMKSYTVAMIFDVGVEAFDRTVAYVPLAGSQGILDHPDRATALCVYLDDPERAEEAKAAIARSVGRSLTIKDWRERNPAVVRELERDKPSPGR